ncbi:MAG: serine/threonine-protein kinase [Proteobacteria bacterium]|nr:serine/threonine-protein kinase [Pseudomonadota bacterium]
MTVRDQAALGETAHAGSSAPATAVDVGVVLEPGQLFRGVRIRALLGAGAMGNAYLASHAHLRMPVVIKLYRATGADALAEAHLAARVVSPAVVPVLDAGLEGDTPFVMQRYVDGVDLDELLRIHLAANRPIPVPVLIRLAVSIFTGLAAIHVAGVVHRDIKPANLFLAGSGEALVGDFGVAVDPQSIQLGEVAGTPMFIAPEIWNGQPATARTDLYAAAATLHLLWQREAPFVASSLVELARMHREDGYRPPAAADPTSAHLGAVLASLLAKDPTSRPESALATARLLQRISTPAPALREATRTARRGSATSRS